MKSRKKYIEYAILAFVAVYTVTMLMNYGDLSETTKAFIMPLIFVLYYSYSDKKCIFFTTFLIAFSMAELTYFIQLYNRDVAYYLSNTCYIVAYASLFTYIILYLDFKALLKRYAFHFIILIALGIYLLFALDKMLNYHGFIPLHDYIIESANNLFVILVLVFSFLQYIFNMTKKTLLLFLASLFLCFSELAQVGYYFVKAGRVVSIAYSTFLIFGFCFTYNYVSDELACES